MEKKISEADLMDKSKLFPANQLIDNFMRGFLVNSHLYDSMDKYSMEETRKFEEFEHIFESLVTVKSFNRHLLPSTRRFLSDYFRIVAEKRTFDILHKKIELLGNFDSRDFLDNLDNMKLIPQIEELEDLKRSDFSRILFDSFFEDTLSRSYQIDKDLKVKIEDFMSSKRGQKATKTIKAILRVIFNQNACLSREVYGFVNNGLDQVRLKKALKGQSGVLFLPKMIELRDSLDQKKCNRFSYNQLCEKIEKATSLELEIKKNLEGEDFFSAKIAQKIQDLYKRAEDLHFRHPLLDAYCQNLEFVKQLHYHANQEFHIDLPSGDSFDLSNLERFLDEKIPLETLEKLRVFEVDKFVFKEVEHLYKKALHKYYELVARTSQSGQKKLKVSIFRDDAKLHAYFKERPCATFENLAKMIKEIELAIVSFMREAGKDFDMLSHLDIHITRIEKILEMADKFEVDDPSLKNDLNYLFEWRMNFELLSSAQWFLNSTVSNKSDPSSPEPPEQIDDNGSIDISFCEGTLENVVFPTSTASSRTPLKTRTGYQLPLKNSMLLENAPLDSTVARQANEDPGMRSLQLRQQLQDVLHRCEISYQYFEMHAASSAAKDIKVETAIQSFRQLYSVYSKSKNDTSEIIRKLQKIQIDTQSSSLKIDEKEIRELVPQWKQFRVFFTDQLNDIFKHLKNFKSIVDNAERFANGLFKLSLDELLAETPKVQIELDKILNCPITSESSKIYYRCLLRINKLVKTNEKSFADFQKRSAKLVDFLKLNFHDFSDFLLVQSIGRQTAVFQEIKEDMDTFQQNEETEENFAGFVERLREYILQPGFKVCFNYESFSELSIEVSAMDCLTKDNFAGFFNLTKGKPTRISPSTFLKMNLNDKLVHINILNKAAAKLTHANEGGSLDYYNFVKEVTGIPCSIYLPVIGMKYDLVVKDRFDMEKNMAAFDEEVGKVIADFERLQNNQITINQFSLSEYANMELSFLDTSVENCFKMERMFYQLKFWTINLLKHIMFGKANNKNWMAKDIYKKTELSDAVRKIRNMSETTVASRSSTKSSVTGECYVFLVNAIRFVDFILGEKDHKASGEFFGKLFQSELAKIELKSEREFLGSRAITDTQSFMAFGANNLFPSVRYIFQRINERMVLAHKQQFAKFYEKISKNEKKPNRMMELYHDTLDRIKKIPFITKNSETTAKISTMCFKIAQAIEAKKTSNAEASSSDVEEVGRHPETGVNADSSREYGFETVATYRRPAAFECESDNVSVFRPKRLQKFRELPSAPKNLEQEVFGFIRSLKNKSAACKQLEKKNFEFEEFWEQFKKSRGNFVSSNEVNSFTESKEQTEYLKSENPESLTKTEEIFAIKSEPTGFSILSPFHKREALADAINVCSDKASDKEKFGGFNSDPAVVKRVKEKVESGAAPANFELSGVRLFEIRIGDLIYQQQKLTVKLLTRKNPSTFTFIEKTQIFFKFETSVQLSNVRPLLTQKVADFKKGRNKRPLVAGWFEIASLRQKPNEGFFRHLKELPAGSCLKECFLFGPTGFEMLILPFGGLTFDLLNFVEFAPATLDKAVDLADLFVFFVCSEKLGRQSEDGLPLDNFVVFERERVVEEETCQFSSWNCMRGFYASLNAPLSDNIDHYNISDGD